MSKQLAHSAAHGGLMEKSIGEIYPLTVSFRGDPNSDSPGWYVWHTLTGRGSSLSFQTPHEAEEYAKTVMSSPDCGVYRYLFQK